MDDRQKIKEEFYELCYSIDEKVIRQMNENNMDVGLNNVVVGLNNECFGLILVDTPQSHFFYQLFYVNGEKGLCGYLLDMTLENPNKDELVFIFSNHLTHDYPNLDPIDVFNTFQQYTRSTLEKEGYFTVSSLEMDKFNGKDTTIIAKGVKGILVIPLIDKVQSFREYFGNRHTRQQIENENYIYLMLNKRNGLIKIGTSSKPSFREKTLQSEEPEIILLTLWVAPKEIEKELHKKFNAKKRRGEWFDLKLKEMKEIKERMIQFD